MALTANKVLVSDNNGDIATSSTDSSKLAYIGSLTSNAEQTGNKVTSLSSANTDTQYPSAKAVYDEIVPNVSASYTAVSNKGGTLPVTQNLANLATAIGSIPSGSSTKYGASIDTLLGDVDANGMLQMPSGSYNLDFSSVEDLSSYALFYKFYMNKTVKQVDLSNLTTVSGVSSLQRAFSSSSIVSIDLSSLKTVSGANGCNYMLTATGSSDNKLTYIDLSELETVSSTSGCAYMLSGQSNLPSTFNSLPKLKTISGNYGLSSFLTVGSGYNNYITSFSFPLLDTITSSGAMENCFRYRTALQHIYFNSVKTTSFGSSYTNQFNNLVYGITGCTIHFPSNVETTIQGLNGYPLFGGTNTVLAFDLTATS